MPKALEEDDGLDKMTQEERLLFLRDNDNCSDWYSWHVHFWGTKWNSSETYVIDDYNVEFDTAWNMPEEIFREISKKYNTTVEVEYADEGIVENSGRTVYENGMLIEDEPGDEEFRNKVWGWANGE